MGHSVWHTITEQTRGIPNGDSREHQRKVCKKENNNRHSKAKEENPTLGHKKTPAPCIFAFAKQTKYTKTYNQSMTDPIKKGP